MDPKTNLDDVQIAEANLSGITNEDGSVTHIARVKIDGQFYVGTGISPMEAIKAAFQQTGMKKFTLGPQAAMEPLVKDLEDPNYRPKTHE